MPPGRFDLTIIGGGIIGLATAMQMGEKYPRVKLLVLEKENRIASHQSGHNSGVIHAGIYYKPGSLKAETCAEGRRALLDFCERNGISYVLCGKVIVATHDQEIPRLEELFRRGTANRVPDLEMIGPERLRELEPYAQGVRAVHSPATGIIDFVQVAEAYARKVKERGGEILTSCEVTGIVQREEGLMIQTPGAEFTSKYLLNCGGLFSDRIARMMIPSDFRRTDPEVQIVPFRGEYYKLIPEKRFLVKGLIYPTPDPRFPFLGVHFTRTVHGYVEAGPNAVLAFAREGYKKTDLNLRDLWETLSYKGFQSLARKYWRMGLEENYRSLSKKAFTNALQRLVPSIREEDLMSGGSGVRAQAIAPDGTLLDDFVIKRMGNAVHVLNAPSPGATASLAIGKKIVEMVAQSFALN